MNVPGDEQPLPPGESSPSEPPPGESPPGPPPSESPPRGGGAPDVVLLALVVEGGAAVLAVILGRVFGHSPLEFVRWTARGAAVGLAASIPPLVAFLACVHAPVGPLARLRSVVDELVLPLFRAAGWFDLLVICLLAGFGEELLFRGLIQARLAALPTGPWVGLVVASVLFGLLHWITPSYAVVAGLIGLYLGWLWIDTGNLLVPIAAHAAYDFVALMYLRWRAGGD